MTIRQLLSPLFIAFIPCGLAALLASFKADVPVALIPIFRFGGIFLILGGLTGWLSLVLTAKKEDSVVIESSELGSKGGSATVGGSGYAAGGPGGFGGGGAGGDAYVGGDGVALGGEAGQGPKGGRGPAEVHGIPNEQFPDGTWLYDYGRGGDAG